MNVIKEVIMVVRQVLFIKEATKEELITLEDIDSRDDYLEVKDKIYCPTEGCQCRMVYVPRGVNIAYFKKLKGEQHNEICPFYIPTGLDGRPRRTLGVRASILKREHKKNMLKGIYKTYLESEEERQERLERERTRARARREKNQQVSNNNNQLEDVANRPTTSIDGESIEDGQKNPPVRRRHSILDVLESDIGDTLVVIGTITEVLNTENQSIITITDKQERQTFKLYLEQVFFENSVFNTPQMLLSLKRMIDYESTIVLSAVGEIITRNETLGMLVLAEEDLTFNGMSLGVLMIKR